MVGFIVECSEAALLVWSSVLSVSSTKLASKIMAATATAT
jgi:hypothetical protein